MTFIKIVKKTFGIIFAVISGLMLVGAIIGIVIREFDMAITFAVICAIFGIPSFFILRKKSNNIKPTRKEKRESTVKSGDILSFGKNKRLKARIAQLESLLTPEMQELSAIQDEITKAKDELAFETKELNSVKAQLVKTKEELETAKKTLIVTDEAVLMQQFGLYEPMYDFKNSEKYRERLDSVRQEQKNMIKEGRAADGNTNWSVNNSATRGRKMVADMQKLLLRAFNSECDEVISKVKFNNIEAAEKRISSSRDAISKLGAIMGVSITYSYYNSKIDELHLAYEYQVKKNEEKEEKKQLRAEMREQEKLDREIAIKRAEIEKEKKHYQNALSAIEVQLAEAKDESRNALLEKQSEITANLERLSAAEKDVDYREANPKAGYVYIISNIGAFGEGVYKIGMTRRLDPQERIDELGDASVPFNFDIHAMIFTKNAPGLEAALHRAFDDRKLNMVNTRREFFRVSLDEIKEVVKRNFDSTVEFVDVPEAEQYRQSMLIKGTRYAAV